MGHREPPGIISCSRVGWGRGPAASCWQKACISVQARHLDLCYVLGAEAFRCQSLWIKHRRDTPKSPSQPLVLSLICSFNGRLVGQVGRQASSPRMSKWCLWLRQTRLVSLDLLFFKREKHSSNNVLLTEQIQTLRELFKVKAELLSPWDNSCYNLVTIFLITLCMFVHLEINLLKGIICLFLCNCLF